MIYLDYKKVFITSLICVNTMFAQTIWLEEAEKRMSWKDAMQYCKDQNAILPTRAIFKKIWIENGKASDIKGFDLSVSFWTSDEKLDNVYAAYPFYFGEGRDTWYYKADHYGVRCIKASK